MQKHQTQLPRTTMNLSHAASVVLNTYIALHPDYSAHDKGKLGSQSIITSLLPSLPKALRDELASKYPELKPYAK